MSGILLACAAASGVLGTIQNNAVAVVSGLGPAAISFVNDGDLRATANLANASIGAWVIPTNATIAALYQIKVDATAGTFDSGTTGTFQDLSTTRDWTKNSGSVTFTYTVREKSTGIVRLVKTGNSLTAP